MHTFRRLIGQQSNWDLRFPFLLPLYADGRLFMYLPRYFMSLKERRGGGMDDGSGTARPSGACGQKTARGRPNQVVYVLCSKGLCNYLIKIIDFVGNSRWDNSMYSGTCGTLDGSYGYCRVMIIWEYIQCACLVPYTLPHPALCSLRCYRVCYKISWRKCAPIETKKKSCWCDVLWLQKETYPLSDCISKSQVLIKMPRVCETDVKVFTETKSGKIWVSWRSSWQLIITSQTASKIVWTRR